MLRYVLQSATRRQEKFVTAIIPNKHRLYYTISTRLS